MQCTCCSSLGSCACTSATHPPFFYFFFFSSNYFALLPAIYWRQSKDKKEMVYIWKGTDWESLSLSLMTKVIMYRIQKTYSVHCKNAIYAPTFLGYNNSVLSLVLPLLLMGSVCIRFTDLFASTLLVTRNWCKRSPLVRLLKWEEGQGIRLNYYTPKMWGHR